MKKLLLILSTLIISVGALANPYVDIGIVDRKGLNKGLVLISELHSVEYVDERESVILEMSSGLKFHFDFSIVPNIQSMGHQVVLEKGVVYKANGKLFAELTKKPTALQIGQKRSFSISSEDKDEVIQIDILPFNKKNAR